MRIDPRHLFLVRAIVENGTFNRAADAIGVSQPALSKSIALLESRLGVKIFERGARGSTLTEAGETLARSAMNLDHLLDRTQQEIAARALRIDGPLVIGATPSMMLGIVPEVVSRITQVQPHVLITLVEGLDDTLRPALELGEIDLLVGPVENLHAAPDLICDTTLAEERLFIGVGEHHPLAKRKSVRLQALDAEAWVLPRPGSSFYRAAEALFISAGMAWPLNRIATNSLATQERLLATAGRIGFQTPAQLYGRNSPVRIVPLAGAPKRSIGVRRIAGIKLPRLADNFIDELSRVLAELPQ